MYTAGWKQSDANTNAVLAVNVGFLCGKGHVRVFVLSHHDVNTLHFRYQNLCNVYRCIRHIK